MVNSIQQSEVHAEKSCSLTVRMPGMQKIMQQADADGIRNEPDYC